LPEIVSVYAGTLDDTSHFRPAKAIFTASRPAWDHVLGDLREYEGHPAESKP
jgi:hypothetical protein